MVMVVYTLGIDEPKIIGDETLFFVANDLDTARLLFLLTVQIRLDLNFRLQPLVIIQNCLKMWFLRNI